MQKNPPTYVIIKTTMVNSDESYDSISSSESSNSCIGSSINTITRNSNPRYIRRDIDVLTGYNFNNNMDNNSPGSEPLTPSMSRLRKRTYSPVATIVRSPKKTTSSKKKGRTSSFHSKSPSSTVNTTEKEVSLQNSLMALLYRKKINAVKQATAQPGNSELQLKAMYATRELYKNLFIMTKRLGKANWFGWKEHFSLISSTDYARRIYCKTDDARECSALSKVLKIERANKGAVVCMICWNNNINSECIFSLDKSFNTTNLSTHLANKHKELNIVHCEDSTVASAKKSSSLKQKLFTKFIPEDTHLADNKSAMKHLYDFFNTSNIAIHQTNNPHFVKFIDFMIDNGNKYKNEKDRSKLLFSRYKYKQQEFVTFSNFIRLIENIVKFSKDYYSKMLNTPSTPFINVSHDGWDSKDNDVLGVSIHFIIPTYWKVVNVAIGLERINSKKSVDVSRAIINILDRYNITIDDVFRGINDTTSSAKATGLLIAQNRAPLIKGQSCNMHAQELVVTHALGLRKRSKNNVIIDKFEESLALKEKVKALVSKIMNKKQKHIFKKYTDYCKQLFNYNVIKLEIPNDTRVSGVFRMYDTLLRSKHAIVNYCTYGNDKRLFNDLMLSDDEWQMVAETHAVLKITNLLAMSSQTQSVDQNCMSFFNVHTARYLLTTKEQFRVVQLKRINSPTTLMKDNKYDNCKTTGLLDFTNQLINRFHIEFDNYFKEPDSDQILMMVFHPLMMRAGFE
jgi:hypothetical protein